MKTITFASVKGGTGKSTLSIMTALSLQSQNKRVLFIDLDPQNSGTFFFTNGNENKSIFKAIMENDIEGNILKTGYGVDLIPSDLRLLDCRTIETNKISKIVEKVSRLTSYDYCIIDTAPTYDNLVINAYRACDVLLIPATVDSFSLKTIHFLFDKFTDLELNADLGIVLNMFTPSKSQNANNWNVRESDLFFKDNRIKDFILKTTIARSTTLHRIIAETNYRITGKTAQTFYDLLSELVNIDIDRKQKIGGLV